MGLLEILAKEMKCSYCSDLRYVENPNSLLHQVVADLPLDQFHEGEWLDAAVYLCDIKCSEATAAKEAILNHF